MSENRQDTEWKPLSDLTLILISHQGEHRFEPCASGHPWGQLPHQPLLQRAGHLFWSGDHTRVPEDACPQEEPQLLPHSQLLSGVWAHHHSLYMCYLQAQLIKTDCSMANEDLGEYQECTFRGHMREEFLRISSFHSLLLFSNRHWKCHYSIHHSN